MTEEQLRERVYGLSEALSWLGMTPDIAAMTICELEAAHRFLLRVARGG